MSRAIPGLHHVTAISGPPQENVGFYAGTLAQRLVKRTVIFVAPDTYHLYYGNAAGEPGTILTFFPFVDAGPGRAGPGMDRLDQVSAGATDISVADRASKAPFKQVTITKKTDSASNEEPIEIVLPDRGSEGRSR